MEQQETEQQKKEKLAPWLDRFMKMANAMYGVDAHNTGELGDMMTSWHRTEARSVDVDIYGKPLGTVKQMLARY